MLDDRGLVHCRHEAEEELGSGRGKSMQVSLRAVLSITFVALIGTTVTFVGVNGYISGRRSANALAAQVMHQTAQRVDSEIDNLLRVAAAQGSLDGRLFATGQLPFDDSRAVSAFFLEAMAVNPELTYLSLGRERDGSYCGVSRNRAGELTVRFLERQPDGALLLTDFDGATGAKTFTEPDKSENEPRPRPYYRAAVQAGKSTWTETYLFLEKEGTAERPGVTYATPVYDSQHALLGVLTADFDLRALSDFLSRLPILDHGFVFVLEYRQDGTRRVIAHPDPSLQSGPEAPAETFGDPAVRAFIDAVPTVFAAAADHQDFEFLSGDVRYVGAWTKIVDASGLQWVVCSLVPEDDILADVNRNLRFQEVVGLVSLGVALALGFLVAARIAGPMQALAVETRSIGQFRLEARSPDGTQVHEVRQLASAIEDMKASLRSFRKYVPADLVRGLLASGREARLGGSKETITVYFSDLVGFTSLAETMPPEALVALLGEYLDGMTPLIIDEGGTVDKYIGDAIMAFWGAPQPSDDHALAACRTALAGQRRLDALNAGWAARGLPSLQCRIGLHTGEAIVGNVGSESRMAYTAIGDTVNLASRLEGLNRMYGSSILMSEATFLRVRDHVIARPLDRVAVKGRGNGTLVYELMALAGDETLRLKAARHTEAVAAYFDRRFEDAIGVLDLILADDPLDKPAGRLRERCLRFRESPPPPGWDGVHHMDTK